MATALRRWLQKHPVPKTIRGFGGDEEEREVELGTARSKWRDAEAALAGCWKLEALSEKGAVLRVLELEAPPDESASSSSASSKMRDELLLVREVAKLLHEAHNAGAERHAQAHKQGFDALVNIVNVTTDRLAKLEKAYGSLLNSLARAANANDPDDPEKQAMGLLQTIMLAKMTGGVPTQPNGAEDGTG